MTSIDALESWLRRLVAGENADARGREGIAGPVAALLAVAATAALAWALVAAGFPSPESLGVLFVIPVLASALLYGLGASLIAAALSVPAYNFALLPPVGHIGLWQPENFAKLTVLGLVAVAASGLASLIRKLAHEALRRESVLSAVYALSQDILGIADVEDMRRAAEVKLSSLLGGEARIRLADEISPEDRAARFCLERNVPAGGGTQHHADDPHLHLPLSSQGTAVGVLRVPANVFSRFPPKILATLAAQAASALDKARLAEAQAKKQRDAEREKFLSALLSSVSHDFKTPLVTVIGALSALKDAPLLRDQRDAREVVTGGLEEARKLDRFITNLVEISRLESGLESIRTEPVLLRDLIASALKSLHPLIGQQRFTILVPPDFPLLKVNAALMELVFLNLLENALKYGPAGGEVKIIARRDDVGAEIDIDDDGDGIPPSEREAIFVKFYRAKHGDRKIAGTGLGLYICRGIVEAHGGRIAAIDPHDGHGACVRVTLPAAALIPVALADEPEDIDPT
jgi:two-component system sensor histidine kinase KdpD